MAHPQTLKIKKYINSIRQCILSVVGSVYCHFSAVYTKMFNFRRITIFCSEKRLSKHTMTICSKNLGGMAPLLPPGYAYALEPRRKFSAYATVPNIARWISGWVPPVACRRLVMLRATA